MAALDHELERDLARLLKHYAALSPSSPTLIPSPPFPAARDLSTPAAQQWLVDHLLPHDRAQEEGARGWKKAFWRRVVKGIEVGFEERRAQGDEAVEDEETHPDLLETMVDFLSSSSAAGSATADGAAPGVSRRVYYYGDLAQPVERWRSIVTREEGRLISGGTTGLRTWQACVALSNHLLANPAVVQPHNRILELGAGVGLLSLVCAKLSATTRITATDVDEKVLEILEANIAENGLQDRVRARSLDWEWAPDPPRGSTTELDQWEAAVWGESGLNAQKRDGRASLILGADIVYDPSLVGPLSATLAWLLRSLSSDASACPTAEALIAGTVRNEQTWSVFLDACRNRDLRVESVEMDSLEGGGIVGAEGWEGEGEVRLVRISARGVAEA
ncbi:hypothetical protein JCM10908_000842 [Rhodotorula pacifica]|uniref:uncharacterized protein n=1 Tax=Rhodotorula pacifica TaxID=1495444 RepID=UPI00316C3052